jgi:hypothetical protein
MRGSGKDQDALACGLRDAIKSTGIRKFCQKPFLSRSRSVFIAHGVCYDELFFISGYDNGMMHITSIRSLTWLSLGPSVGFDLQHGLCNTPHSPLCAAGPRRSWRMESMDAAALPHMALVLMAAARAATEHPRPKKHLYQHRRARYHTRCSHGRRLRAPQDPQVVEGPALIVPGRDHGAAPRPSAPWSAPVGPWPHPVGGLGRRTLTPEGSGAVSALSEGYFGGAIQAARAAGRQLAGSRACRAPLPLAAAGAKLCAALASLPLRH